MAEKPAAGKKTKTVVFFHPDLGIGGAERLVVDAAVGLQNRGHRVVIFTSHCDPAHCFDEVRPDGTGIVDVRVRGGSLVPPSLGGRFAIFCAIARQAHLLIQIGLLTNELAALAPTAFFVDQLSAGLPLLRILTGGATPILFYCHFPDLLLAKGRQRWWKRLYRVPFDALEQWSMGFADAVAVNSNFTKSVVAATWPKLAAGVGSSSQASSLRVVYPCIDTKQEDVYQAEHGPAVGGSSDLWKGKPFLLSINRFERKKDVGLAVRAFAGLPAVVREGARLVVAGGYDNRVAENVEHHRELDELATGLGLRTATAKTMVTALNVPDDIQVLFLLSVPSALKALLLHAPGSRLLVYTPANEHFGIVPLEAMLAGLPVLACNSGGPTETVVEGETGWLRPADDVAAWTAIMRQVLPDPAKAGSTGLPESKRKAMAAAGQERVRSLFADVQMAARLDGILDEIQGGAAGGGKGIPSVAGILLWLTLAVGLLVALSAVTLKRIF